MALLLSAVAAIGFGVSDFVGGLASRRVHALRVVLLSYPLSILAIGLAAPLVAGSSPLCWSAARSASRWTRPGRRVHPTGGLADGGSGAAFAGYFVLLDQVDAGTGLWPLLASRVGDGGRGAVLVAVAIGLIAGAS